MFLVYLTLLIRLLIGRGVISERDKSIWNAYFYNQKLRMGKFRYWM